VDEKEDQDMRNLYHVLTIRGMPVRLHYTWLIAALLSVPVMSGVIIPIYLPDMGGLARFGLALLILALFFLSVVLHEGAAPSMGSLDVPSAGSLVVVVGPEGGMSDEELAAFEAAGAHAVRLGAEVLRTSTAGVAAVAALLSRTARWR
jgi:hypothetical protein